MKIDKKTLWNVPLFCVISGMITFYVVGFLTDQFFAVMPTDESITFYPTGMLIMYGVIFVTTLAVGGMRFFRNMTRKEIFCSASIIVAIGFIARLARPSIVLTAVSSSMQTYTMASLDTLLFTKIFQLFEWGYFVPLLLGQLEIHWGISILSGVFVPYLFIPFGKKD